MNMTKTELMRNAFYAMAVCDAVGNKFEFNSNPDPQEVIQYANGAISLEITDDTQMALFTAQAINDYLNANHTEVDSFNRFVEIAYHDWYLTQTECYTGRYDTEDGLLQFQSMFKIQAPGTTCLKSCEYIGRGFPVKNNSMGCGAVMRLLPFAGLFGSRLDYVKMAVNSGLTTHLHYSIPSSIERYIIAMFEATNGGIATKDYPFIFKKDHISQLGEGWVAPEAVDMAIWAAGVATDFDHLLALSIAHPGDSDSVGAMAGALWGLMGKDVPIKYMDKIVEKDAIDYVLNYEFLKGK